MGAPGGMGHPGGMGPPGGALNGGDGKLVICKYILCEL